MELSPIEILEAIAGAYETALHALQGSDLSKLETILNEVDALTRELGELGSLDAPQELMQEIRQNHSKLLATLSVEHEQTAMAVSQSQTGRRALKAYGGRSPVTGTKVESIS